MGALDQTFGVLTRNAGQGDDKIRSKAEAAFCAGAYADRRCDGGVVWHRYLEAVGDSLDSTQEAGGISRGKKLLGVAAVAAGASQLFRRRKGNIESPVFSSGAPLTPARRRCGGTISYVN